MPGKFSKSWKGEYLLVAGFALALVVLGGSSRFDMIQQSALRAFAALFLVPAVYLVWKRGPGDGRPLLALLIGVIALTALQLLPLPPAIWQALPGRDVVARIDEAVGLGDTWRAMTMTPTRTANALAATIVPLTALLLAIGTRITARALLAVIAGVATANFALGMMQLLNPGNGALFFYSITNPGTAVGIFANKNHAAVFSALAMLVFTRLAIESALARSNSPVFFVQAGGAVAMFLVALVTGSRAGLLAAIFASATAAVMVWIAFNRHGGRSARRMSAKKRRTVGILFAVGTIAVVSILLFAFALGDNLSAWERLADRSAIEDMRVKLLPVIIDMMATFWLIGSGFGSFEQVYHMFEPDALLASHVINQAHNDWAQLVIEGGVPAVALLALLFGWTIRKVAAIFHSSHAVPGLAWFWVGIFLIIAAASLVDYPVRAPTFMAVAIWLLVLLSLDAAATRDTPAEAAV